VKSALFALIKPTVLVSVLHVFILEFPYANRGVDSAVNIEL
jgi:hypothetical protein